MVTMAITTRIRIWAAILLIVAIPAVLYEPAAAQAPPAGAVPGLIAPAEAAALAAGWTALQQGDLARAAAASAAALRDYPRNPASIALAVEVGIARQGWRGGLDAYDQWVSGRTVDNFYALRRVARAVLYDTLRTSSNVELRLDVVRTLVQDGESNVTAQIPETAGSTQQMRAATGDAKAVAALAAGLRDDPRPTVSIEALSRSRSPAAVAPLVGMLTSSRSEVRAAAAKGLGTLEATSAIPRLREMLKDPQLLPRMAAAGSLMRMGDTSASTLLMEWFNSDVGDVRLKAAEISAINPDANWTAQVRRLLQDTDPMTRLRAAQLISRHEPSTGRWVLQQLANDQNLAIREEAQRVLPESLGGDFTELRRYLRAADGDIRARAALRIVELTR